MCNYFKFHAVGQGLFYSGSLDKGKFNFVYDCGTSTNQKYVQREINSLLKDLNYDSKHRPVFDFVAISHLHYDHYSGLKYLMEHSQIKKILLPYFPREFNLLNLILYYDMIVKTGKNYEDCRQQAEFISGLYGQIYDSNSYHFPEIHINDDYIRPEIRVVLPSKINVNKCINNSEYIDCKYWKFVFINKIWDNLDIIKDKIECILTAKMRQPYAERSFVDYIATCDNKYNEIKDIYNAVFGKNFNLNLTSTVMLHYPIAVQNCEYNKNISYDHNFSEGTPTTLLCGDAEFDNQMTKELKSALPQNTELDDITILQVPHHGSAKNWKTVVENGIFAKKYIIPFGLGNGYGHPSKNVIDEIFTLGYDYSTVTQLNPFKYEIF